MHSPILAVSSIHRSAVFAAAIVIVLAIGMLPARASGATTGFTVGIAADMRNYAGSGTYDTVAYYRGAIQAMKARGTPAFILGPGDEDPPANVKWTNDQVFGTGMQWYPVVGNHERETASDMDYLRKFNYDVNGTSAEPNIVNKGPSACPQTTFSFDYQNTHFAVLNVYCNSSGDAANTSLGGDVPDYLYNWLSADLAASTKQYKFVVGHSPAYVQADQDNGRIRHVGEALDAHPANRDRFWSLLKSQNVVAYIVGHTHDYSAVQINGVWQIDAGHARGSGDTGAPSTFVMLNVTSDSVTFDAYREKFDGVYDYDDIVHHGTLRGTTSPTSTPTPSATATRTNTPSATNTPTRTPTSVGTATSTPTATATAGSSFQPLPPIQAAFFYPWFPEAWTQGGVYPYSNYTPSLGYYSSTDDATIDKQLSLAATAHLDAFISSWWGQGHHTDTALQYILGRSARAGSPNPNLRWAIYYEAEGQGDPTSAQIVSDLQYLQSKVFSSPAYLRVNGKPVVFVYAGATDGSGMAQRWAQAKKDFGGNVYVVLKVYAGYASDPNQPDSWHQYAPAVGYDGQGTYSATVSPGFWLKGQAVRLARDPVRFESDVKKMVASNATWQLITTWSEWGEGTIVEPAAEFGNTYVDILCRNIPGTAPCAGTSTPTPTATNTSTPTPTNTPTATPTRAPVTVTVVPSADSWVDPTYPTTNYGTSTQIRVDGSPTVRSYLAFNVQGVSGTVSKATLRIYANSASSSGVSVRGLADPGATWSEATINYNNSPAISSTITATSPAVAAGTWISLDVTPLVTGNGAKQIALTTAGSTAISLASRHSGATSPQLIVEYK